MDENLLNQPINQQFGTLDITRNVSSCSPPIRAGVHGSRDELSNTLAMASPTISQRIRGMIRRARTEDRRDTCHEPGIEETAYASTPSSIYRNGHQRTRQRKV